MSWSRWRTVNAAAICWLAACGGGQGADATYVPAAQWGASEAALVCAKIFACCNAAESARLGYASEAQCRQAGGSTAQKNLDQLLTGYYQVYDGAAARSCLDEAATLSCAAFFPAGLPVVAGPSCAKVLTGAFKLGDACEDLDRACQSGDCVSGYCAARPCSDVTCSATEYCDPATNGCLPVKPAGAACGAGAECDQALGCHGGACGPPLPAGAACVTSADCAAGSCQPVAGAAPPASTCVAPLGDGSPCYFASECASGACTYPGASTGNTRLCGPPVCDGLP